MARRPRRALGPSFGLEFSKCMVARSLSASDLERMLSRARRPLTKQFLGMLMHNKRNATPDTLDSISRALVLSEADEQRLHRAAAIDAGFKIGGM